MVTGYKERPPFDKLRASGEFKKTYGVIAAPRTLFLARIAV
jgi:hypothetical protein